MTVEYDLIVIGGSTAGIYAAIAAAKLKARVALIENERVQTNWLGHGAIYAQALNQVGRVREQVREATQFGVHFPLADATEQSQVSSVQLNEAMQWAQTVVYTCSEQNSPAILASLGVDVITGIGEFCRRPHLGFVVNDRRMRSRAYLIATGSRPVIPDIAGLPTIGYLTPADIWQPNFAQRLQGNWVVIGDGPIGTELAQTLARLNCEVTLVINASHILPDEDPEASRLVQAQLEAEGIRVLTESPVAHVRQIEGKKWVQAGNRAIEADEILLATDHQLNVEAFNLEGVGVKFTPQGLELNEKLQTTNSRIYACGNVAGGQPFAHIAQYEASIALKNALFAPVFKVDYHGIPWAVFSNPQLARVGLTEAQARGRYGKDVFVVRQYFKTLDKAQILGDTTGFCKIVGRENGEILGASIVGADASELIGVIALAIRQKLKVKAIANLPQISPTLSEIIHKTAIEWQQQRRSRNKSLQNFLEGFFNLRRNWSS
ncbi:MAG: NAD(P)/FAD-dependent oxidoreductase [Microcoleus sp. SIO2G3]|nr:NAD(P)/FAD-dependent oxidoreductase [Microcoleus sp. SIO2G3]